MLVPAAQWQQTDDLRALCSSILSTTTPEPDKYQVGLTKIFFRAGLLARFEQLRTSRLNELSTLIQKNVRRFLAVRDYGRARKAIVGIQAAWRAREARRVVEGLKREKAAVLIQKQARGFLERVRYERTKKLIVAIQASASTSSSPPSYNDER
jgi:myosin-5